MTVSKDTLEKLTKLVNQDPLLSTMEERGNRIMAMRAYRQFFVSEKIKRIKAQKKMEREQNK